MIFKPFTQQHLDALKAIRSELSALPPADALEERLQALAQSIDLKLLVPETEGVTGFMCGLFFGVAVQDRVSAGHEMEAFLCEK